MKEAQAVKRDPDNLPPPKSAEEWRDRASREDLAVARAENTFKLSETVGSGFADCKWETVILYNPDGLKFCNQWLRFTSTGTLATWTLHLAEKPLVTERHAFLWQSHEQSTGEPTGKSV